MEPVTGLDAAFLALETPTSPLHVTGVLVFDPATMPGDYSFDKVKRFVASRVHVTSKFRQRLRGVPLGLGRPVWIDDPDFDLDYHVRRAALPTPGGAQELTDFAAQVAGRPLDRSRPLWEMWFVEGVEGGHVALVATMHHATIDGVSGANLMAHLLDLEPKPVEESPPAEEWRPERVPSDAELVGRALIGRVRRRLRLARTAGATARAVGGLVERRLLRRHPTMVTPFTPPSTRFNRAITPHRRIAFATVPLQSVRQVKAAFGVTVNDVVLALCSGAMRRYLESHDELPRRPLAAAVPVSTRNAVEGTAATQVSAMIVSLATNVADPVERLRAVSASARVAKEEHQAMGGELVAELSEFAANQIFALGVHLYSSLHLAGRFPPAANLIISNVPGPDFPLYFAGGKLVALYPLGPIYEGMALNVTVFSYLDVVGFGLVCCAELAPDLSDLAGAVSETLQELEKQAALNS